MSDSDRTKAEQRDTERGRLTYERPADWDEPTVIPDIPGELERILVPFNGTTHGELGLAHASRLATWTGAELIVVVAYDPPIAGRRRGVLEVEGLRAEMEADAKEIATEASELLAARGHRVRAIVIRGDPVDAILDTAESEQVGLIVMGHRSLSTLTGLLSGAVAERVARYAHAPVLLVSR
ncbi:MAG TPA: universal stress protein [Acidimicrobiales bacterium]|nr:universal stress protein [Acidimicrobiales bacterium]